MAKWAAWTSCASRPTCGLCARPAVTDAMGFFLFLGLASVFLV